MFFKKRIHVMNPFQGEKMRVGRLADQRRQEDQREKPRQHHEPRGAKRRAGDARGGTDRPGDARPVGCSAGIDARVGRHAVAPCRGVQRRKDAE